MNSSQTAVSDGSLALLNISFEYFDRTHVHVLFNGVEQTLGTTWSWVGSTNKTIQFSPAVAAGVIVEVRRVTPLNSPRHIYSSPGNAPFNKLTVDENFRQALFASQEAAEGASLTTFAQDVSAAGNKLTELGDAMLDGDAVSLKVLREYLPYGPAAASLSARLATEEAVTSRLGQQGVLDGTLLLSTFNAAGITDGAWVFFAGRDSVGDGGGGLFRYSSTSLQTPDSGLVFAPTGGGRLFRDGWTVLGFNGHINVKWFGAKGNGTTVDTAAVQAALNYAQQNGKTLFFPRAVYVVSNLVVTNGSYGGFKIVGESTGDFLFNSGSILKAQAGTGVLKLDGTASMMWVDIAGITFDGGLGGVYGLLVDRGWYFNVTKNTFRNFNANSACKGIWLTYTSGSFVGVITAQDNVFEDCYAGIFWDKVDVNCVHILYNKFTGNTFPILQGVAGVACSSRNVNIIGNLFDGNSDYDVFSYGGAQNWNILGNYFEQNDSSKNTPRIRLGAQGVSPINAAIKISGNTYSKQLAAAGTALIFIDGVDGVEITSNWSAFGNQSDRYAVEILNGKHITVEPFAVPSGVTPYPVKCGSLVFANGKVEDHGGLYLGNTNSTNPNILDWYQEGTFTPVIQGGSVAGTTTYTVQRGRYTRVGKLVHIECEVNWNSATGTGALVLNGLPFVSSVDAEVPLTTQLGSVTYTGNSPVARVFPNATFCQFHSQASAASLAIVNMSASGVVRVAGTYLTGN